MPSLKLTADGSHTVVPDNAEVSYHSKHGAITESKHVFVTAGFTYYVNQWKPASISVLEMGFGTGLNALLTALQADIFRIPVNYTSIELYPLPGDIINAINYPSLINEENAAAYFRRLHEAPWNIQTPISERFSLLKQKLAVQDFESNANYDVIFFDAFAPSFQPELWSIDIFRKMFDCLNHAGVLVTYCSKGEVRRTMQAAGFRVEKLPGPPGKREMVRATRLEL